MAKWIGKINWAKLLLIALLYTLVAQIVHTVEAMLTMKYYAMPQYFGVWSKVMMPSAGPPPTEFYITSGIMTFVTGLALGLVYYYLRDFLPKNMRDRVFLFADLLIGLNFIFFSLPVYLMFNLPLELIVSWFVSSFIILLSASFLLVKIVK